MLCANRIVKLSEDCISVEYRVARDTRPVVGWVSGTFSVLSNMSLSLFVGDRLCVGLVAITSNSILSIYGYHGKTVYISMLELEPRRQNTRENSEARCSFHQNTLPYPSTYIFIVERSSSLWVVRVCRATAQFWITTMDADPDPGAGGVRDKPNHHAYCDNELGAHLFFSPPINTILQSSQVKGMSNPDSGLPLNSTLGAAYLGTLAAALYVWISSVGSTYESNTLSSKRMYGLTTLQTFLYFNSPITDKRWLSSMVCLRIFLLQSLLALTTTPWPHLDCRPLVGLKLSSKI